jgi:cell division protein FtsW (lipid II flippase)
MSFEEKGTWVSLLVTVGTYVAYLIIILGRADGAPLTEVSYVSTLLWTIGIAIGLQIIGRIAVAVAKPSEADKSDVRDKEINRFGDYVGQSLVVVGGLAALIMAMAEVDHFWIANTLYLAFVLSGILAAVTKLVAYRRGFQRW